MLNLETNIKILVVDDDTFNLDILTEHLSLAGYDVIQAEDGDMALKMVHNHPDIAAIVLDRMMPRIDGMEVLKIIKGNSRLHTIPVIMQTAMATPNQKLDGMRAGAYGYLTKPYEDDELVSIVKSALEVKNM